MARYKVQQFSGGQVKFFNSYNKAMAQYQLWVREANMRHNAGESFFVQTVLESDLEGGCTIGYTIPDYAMPSLSEVEQPKTKQVSISPALQRPQKPATVQKQPRKIAGGTPFGHPYVPTPDEVVYPDSAIIRTK